MKTCFIASNEKGCWARGETMHKALSAIKFKGGLTVVYFITGDNEAFIDGVGYINRSHDSTCHEIGKFLTHPKTKEFVT